ncbi:MAG TPA: c-type cytochrome domain-containing protein [Chthoniobacteraceae bacterium]
MRLFFLSATVTVLLSIADPAFGAVSFRAEIAPLLQRHCSTCHSEDNSKGKYRLDTFERLMKTGDSGDAPIVPGKADDSELYQRLTETDPTDRMPQKADTLPADEIARIGQWINEGAHFDGGAPDRPLVEFAREALLHKAPERYSRPLPISALAFSPDGSELAVSGYYEVTIWKIADGSLVRRLGGLPERITSLAWSPERNLLAVGGGTPNQWGGVALVDPSGATPPRYLCDLSETALCVVFNSGGTLLAASGGDRTLRFFDPESGRQIRILRQHADWVQTVAFNPEGDRLVTASRDRTSRIFNAATGELEASDTEHETPVLTALFDENGARILGLERSRVVQTWDFRSHDKKAIKNDFKSFEGEPREMLLWGGNLIVGGSSPLITIHQVSDHQRLFTLYGHHDSVGALALSPDQAFLASGGADGEVLIWDLSGGEWINRFKASPGW